MVFLSPEKLLLVLVAVVVVLGPEKLPRAAHQLGGLWRALSSLRTRLEAEARSASPELPNFASITDAMRSPLAYLDRLADGPADRRDELSTTEAFPQEPSASVEGAPEKAAPRTGEKLFVDPSLN